MSDNTIDVVFLGGAGSVTGSKFLIKTSHLNVLVDCGMFQGEKKLRQLNWEPLTIEPSSIDLVVLTHGHLDHVGYLPKLVKDGFNGSIIGTAPTLAIARIVLLDSAKINEEYAEESNRKGFSKHQPALPLYTIEDAENATYRFQPQPKNEALKVDNAISITFRYNGHILGACFVEIEIYGKVLIFSGDVGRNDDLLLYEPEKPEKADFLFLESTYGDQLHPLEDVSQKLTAIVNETISNQGSLIIPSFAVERLQILAYLLWHLRKQNRIPNIPIVVDSPMGNSVFSLFKRFGHWHKLAINDYESIQKEVIFVENYGETWDIIDDTRSKIIIAGSGMVTGGRVLTYLKKLGSDLRNAILLVGYMAEGTRGYDLLNGATTLKMFGKYYPINAKLYHVQSLSAHADQRELIQWLEKINSNPTIFLIHGESDALNVLSKKIKDTYQWNTYIPKLNERVRLFPNN